MSRPFAATAPSNWPLRLALVAVASLTGGAAAASWADECACRQSAAGSCERWHQNEVDWSLHFGAGAVNIPDGTFEYMAVRAFDAWQSVQCSVCPAVSSNGGACVPSVCAPHSMGLAFRYLGRSNVETIGFSCGGTYCSAAGPGTAQIAVVRDPAQWPVSQLVVSAMITTTSKSGKVLDTDIVLRDDGVAFCTDACKDGQYALSAVMMQEVTHFVGLGFAQSSLSTLAKNASGAAAQTPVVDPSDAECACAMYATSEFLADCATPTTVKVVDMQSGSACGAGRAAGADSAWLLAFGTLAAFALLALRHSRKGTNSSAP